MFVNSFPAELTEIFSRFAGQEVPLMEKAWRVERRGLGAIEGSELALADEKDPVLADLQKTANENGLILRAYWSGMPRIEPYYTPHCLNVHIARAGDGKYRIENDFFLG